MLPERETEGTGFEPATLAGDRFQGGFLTIRTPSLIQRPSYSILIQIVFRVNSISITISIRARAMNSGLLHGWDVSFLKYNSRIKRDFSSFEVLHVSFLSHVYYFLCVEHFLYFFLIYPIDEFT